MIIIQYGRLYNESIHPHNNVQSHNDVLSKQKEWICSLFKEWILEKSEIRVNLEWTFVLFTHFGVTTGIPSDPWGHSKMSE